MYVVFLEASSVIGSQYKSYNKIVNNFQTSDCQSKYSRPISFRSTVSS